MTAAMAVRAVQDGTRRLAEVGRRGFWLSSVGVARKWLPAFFALAGEAR
jgi:hypothetical protein